MILFYRKGGGWPRQRWCSGNLNTRVKQTLAGLGLLPMNLRCYALHPRGDVMGRTQIKAQILPQRVRMRAHAEESGYKATEREQGEATQGHKGSGVDRGKPSQKEDSSLSQQNPCGLELGGKGSKRDWSYLEKVCAPQIFYSQLTLGIHLKP